MELTLSLPLLSFSVIFYFLVDRILGLWFYRTGEASIIHKELLDDDYAIVFLYAPRQKRRRLVGSSYYLTFPSLEGMFEISHPFISFQVCGGLSAKSLLFSNHPFFFFSLLESFRATVAA